LRYDLENRAAPPAKRTKAEGQLARRDALYGEIRELYDRWTDDDAVVAARLLGCALLLVHLKTESTPARAGALAAELIQLKQRHRDHPIWEDIAGILKPRGETGPTTGDGSP
jgi:hypothetical protein